MDKAHNNTDKKLDELKKDLQKLYSQAFKEIKSEAFEILDKMSLTFDMTALERFAEANKHDRLKRAEDTIISLLQKTNRSAILLINAAILNVYWANYESMAERIQKQSDKPLHFQDLTKSDTKEEVEENYSPFKQIALDNLKDRAILRSSITSLLAQAIASGGTDFLLKEAIKDATERSLNSTIKISVTETTRIENTARLAAMEDAGRQGVKIIKQWRSQRDERVRKAHARADGQQADIERDFYVGGERLLIPGDIAGSPENVINCRCYIEAVILN